MAFDPSIVGRAFAPVTQVHTERDVMLYALGVGCGADDLDFTYERDLKVLPTYAVVPAFPALLGVMSGLDLDPLSIVHVAQRIDLNGAIPVCGTLTTRAVIEAVDDWRTGALVVVALETTDDGGRPLFRTIWSLLVRGAGGFGGQRRPLEPRQALPPRPPDVSRSMKTHPEQALLYRLSGDRNPLHADDDVARAAGFPRAILHGLCTFGFAGRAVLDAWCGRDPGRMKSLEARFSAAVLPGQALQVEMWRTTPGKIVLRVRSEAGAAVMSAAATIDLSAGLGAIEETEQLQGKDEIP